jgi:hypothetical protein
MSAQKENSCFKKILLHFLCVLLEYKDGAQSLERLSSVSKLHAEMRQSKLSTVINNHQWKDTDVVQNEHIHVVFLPFSFLCFHPKCH